MRKLSKYEKETIINWNEAENLASIYTFNASLKRRLAEFSRKYPLLCRLERSTPERSVDRQRTAGVKGCGSPVATFAAKPQKHRPRRQPRPTPIGRVQGGSACAVCRGGEPLLRCPEVENLIDGAVGKQSLR